MVLKRLPADLTFDSVRNQPSPFARTLPKGRDSEGEDAEARKDKEDIALAVSGRETEKLAPGRDVGIMAEKREDRPAVEKPVAEPPVEPEPQSNVSGSRSGPHVPSPRPSRNVNNKETVILKGRICPPADGVTPIYDSVKAGYDEKAALKHLINLALQGYSTALLSGDENALEEQPDFASHPPSRVTYPSRSVSRKFYEAAKAHIDPLGIMAPSTLSTKIMRTALAWYVARNPAKH